MELRRTRMIRVHISNGTAFHLPEGRACRIGVKSRPMQESRALWQKTSLLYIVKAAEQQSVPCACAQGTLVPCFLLPLSSCFLDYNVPCTTRGQPTPLWSEFPNFRISETSFSENQGGNTTKTAALARSHRDLSIDTTLGACTLPVVEQSSLENHPKGCARVLLLLSSTRLPGTTHLASYTRCWVRGLLKFKFDEK